MCQHVRKAAQDHIVQKTAGDAAWRFGGMHGTREDAPGVAGAAFWWCKLFVKFVHHELIIRRAIGELGHLQGLISPEVLVRMKAPEGDCAIFSECVAAFLTVFGIPYEFVTVAVNPNEPDVFSHVYLYAVLPDGTRLPLDASHGKYPGWQVPSADVFKRQVWDADGNPVADRASRFDGLHNYGLRGMRGFCGLGATVCDDMGCYDDGTGADVAATATDVSSATPYTSNDYYPTTAPAGQYLTSAGTTYSGSTYTAPSQSNTTQWAAFATALAKSGMTLAEINAIQPGTVVSANGAILRQNPGYAVPASGTSSLNTALGGNGILYIGLAALAFLAFSMKGKG
jgi:hypothetical protein